MPISKKYILMMLVFFLAAGTGAAQLHLPPDTALAAGASRIVTAGKGRHLKIEKAYKIQLVLSGIYIHDDVMFFHVRIRNMSNIHYDVDFLRFFIRDQEKLKRTASQEVTLRPVFTHGNDQRIKANSQQDIVYALNKFTIPDAKNLLIEMFEENGGRHLAMAIKNKTIVNARLLP